MNCLLFIVPLCSFVSRIQTFKIFSGICVGCGGGQVFCWFSRSFLTSESQSTSPVFYSPTVCFTDRSSCYNTYSYRADRYSYRYSYSYRYRAELMMTTNDRKTICLLFICLYPCSFTHCSGHCVFAVFTPDVACEVYNILTFTVHVL